MTVTSAQAGSTAGPWPVGESSERLRAVTADRDGTADGEGGIGRRPRHGEVAAGSPATRCGTAPRCGPG
ncbi:hypothetical protein ABT075_17570 [Streptomyces sp. NPDC002677]|uniref:hypothetical protein n=1 Tax=Streptomyces sp. NPDC002677 TaxID=3154774 RepID=UPI00332433BA